MRCNWRIYAEEFALATRLALGVEADVRFLPEGSALSAFERKYRASGHALYSVSLSCDAGAV
jgi:tRNA (guanine-N7-)-methyltransferase